MMKKVILLWFVFVCGVFAFRNSGNKRLCQETGQRKGSVNYRRTKSDNGTERKRGGYTYSLGSTFDDVKKVISKQLSVEEEKIQMESNFTKDLGADSLDLVELIMALEEKFNITISDQDALKISTVQDAIDFIEKNKKSDAGGEVSNHTCSAKKPIWKKARTPFHMALPKRNALLKTTVLCYYLLLTAPFCNITTTTLCHGFILKHTPTLEAFLSGRDSTKKGLSNDHLRRNIFKNRSNTMCVHGKKKGKNKEVLHQVQEIINKQNLHKGNEEDEQDQEEEEDHGERAKGKGKGTSNPRTGQERNTQKSHKGNMPKETPGGKNKTADLYLRNNIRIKSSLTEEEEEDGVEVGRDTEEDPLTEDASSMEDISPDDEEEQEEPVTEEDLDTLNKACAEKMESVYSYIKKESYRFNLNSLSNTMFENERIKINDQNHIIKHISHIKKKENLFIITPYDPYYVNFIYNHFVKEYKELKFYVKDRSVYAVVPPLSENLKNEIRIKIKGKIEDAKGTLRNVRKQMLTKLEKVRGRIGKDIYFAQRNHIQSLHDQTRKRIEAILNELR
ncbi:acyl carrier protein [Plasmodium fragile]|uniref:Acyl carrier protein n=1 Tax=Plasmodium fragile TaxID=5857 RepID=A0A0D9QHH0_PLAFR|nr:acyl carrier protein [Plasmodium fragile]KJP86530.1 acyl carrier protein [Plasmodium fragile]